MPFADLAIIAVGVITSWSATGRLDIIAGRRNRHSQRRLTAFEDHP
jgi:hypothetical protein